MVVAVRTGERSFRDDRPAVRPTIGRVSRLRAFTVSELCSRLPDGRNVPALDITMKYSPAPFCVPQEPATEKYGRAYAPGAPLLSLAVDRYAPCYLARVRSPGTPPTRRAATSTVFSRAFGACIESRTPSLSDRPRNKRGRRALTGPVDRFPCGKTYLWGQVRAAGWLDDADSSPTRTREA